MPSTVPKNIDKYFYNRKNDLKKINRFIDSIYEDLPSQLLISGKRGVGKTFLLKKILNDKKEDTLGIYIDVSKVYAKYGNNISEEAILKEILNQYKDFLDKNLNLLGKLKNSLNNLKLKNYEYKDSASIFNIPIPKITDNYPKLNEFIMNLPQNIVDSSENIKGVILVIDEFQLLKYVKSPYAFFWLFRSFIQEQHNVSYIFTGSVSKTAEVIQMINGQDGVFGGRMIQIDIEPFTKKETLNYINDKSDGIKFTDKGFDRFYKCTRGIPAYINPFCNMLTKGIVYDEEMIKETFFMEMDHIVILWLYVWGALNLYEKEIVNILVENGPLSLNELKKISNRSKNTIIKYLDSVSNKGIVSYNNKYTLDDKMLETWLKHKKDTDGYLPLY